MPIALAPPAPPEAQSTTTYRLSTANTSTAAHVLRDLVRALLKSTGHASLAQSARLCTSEIVTNVFRHTHAFLVVVDVTVGENQVSIYVHDDRPRDIPMPRELSDAEHGHGLYIVNACADAWGVTYFGGLIPTSKAVWFRLVTGGRGAA
ncbi:ATP-binding protein [Streptomyces sp. Da 82-17]|uniref:ATP-binding protein n=1 Tax=Streptomyces sp. Da 82-17 TaxID=3377116 RepID=UPI0038D40CA4